MLVFLAKDLFHYRKQTFLSITGLALVVFCYLILAGLSRTLDNLIYFNTLSRNLILTERDFIDPGDADIDPGTLQVLSEMPPDLIAHTVPMIFRHMRIGDNIVQLRAARVSDWETTLGMELVNGRWPAKKNEVAVGEGASRAQGWVIGQTISVYGREFLISGVFRSPGLMFASVMASYETAQELFSPRATPQFVYIQAAIGIDAETLRQQLEADPRINERYAVYHEENYTQRNTQLTKDLARLMQHY
jgi:hypothetical protein